ncbi:MAG: hypothetical protein SGI74_02145 [Oligoflexia bacterium]|nr:hypothetical protein [Oligoflexia bacterium]
MMYLRNLTLAFLSVLLFSMAAVAKDGPFPVAGAVGKWWVSQGSSSKYSVQIEVGKNYSKNILKLDDQKEIIVSVVLRDEKNIVVGTGTKVHKLKKSVLVVPMYDLRTGQSFQLVMRAIYDNVRSTNARPFKLSADVVDLYDQLNPLRRLVLERLN